MVSTPEMRLLVQCVPSQFGAERILINNSPSIDWATLLHLATWHGMLPLLSSCLLAPASQASDHGIPEPIVSTLRQQQARYLHRGLTKTVALTQLQREFDRDGVKILPWKGPLVGLLLYGSAVLRDSSDLDFLFRKEDLPQLMNVTRRLGYKLVGGTDVESKDLYVRTLHREFGFGRPPEPLLLEFHLQTMPTRFHLWQDAQNDIERADTVCPLADVELTLQRPDDLLVSLCVHATKHYWDRVKWSCDIAQFLRVYGEKLDWPRLLASLRRSRKDSTVLLGLAVAANLYQLELPISVSQALQRAPKVTALANDLAAHVMSGQTTPIEVLKQKACLALLCPRLRDRLVYAIYPLVELNYEDLYIPVANRKLFFINYLFRAIRLFRKYGPQRLATKTAISVRSVH